MLVMEKGNRADRSARKMPEHAELLKRKQRLTMDYRASMKSIVASAGSPEAGRPKNCARRRA